MTIKTIQNNFITPKMPAFKGNIEDDTIKGVLLNRYIQKQNIQKDIYEIDAVSDALFIPEKAVEEKKQEEIKNEFDYKKTLKPVVIAAGATIATIAGISAILSGYSGKLANEKGLVCPPDLATNVNILEEPHFALYRALIKPSGKNIFGFLGVGLFSGITLAAKTIVDGASDVWVKKQECDIEHDFQKNMIQVDRDIFTGKLNVVNKMLKDKADYFKETFSDKQKSAFSGFLSFKGKEENIDEDKENKKKKYKNLAIVAGAVAGIAGISFLVFKNYQKTAKNLGSYMQKCEDIDVKVHIEKIIENPDKDSAVAEMKNLIKSTNIPEKDVLEKFSSIKGVTAKEAKKAAKEAIAGREIYSVPPEALGGVSNKIQYYCYINEERGHLYNWILHPENPFNKYLFLGFSLVSSIGYIANKVADAVKKVTVARENSKSELNLKRNLVAVEIENFRAKKESAINPLVDNFNLQMQNGKSKEELKEAAQNILIEIKKGPPYVYS